MANCIPSPAVVFSVLIALYNEQSSFMALLSLFIESNLVNAQTTLIVLVISVTSVVYPGMCKIRYVVFQKVHFTYKKEKED